MALGNNIKRIRIARRLTQKQLGELCGINEAQLRRYELGGKNSKPKIETLQKIANALNISVDQVCVKATTEEGLGFTGEGLGISSQAIALLM